jgi:hypothetical protein
VPGTVSLSNAHRPRRTRDHGCTSPRAEDSCWVRWSEPAGPRTDDNSREGAARLPRPRGRASRQFEDLWRSVSDALPGVASARVIEFIRTAVPGFREQLSRRQSSTADGRSS